MRRVEFVPTGAAFTRTGYMHDDGTIHGVRAFGGGYATLYTTPGFYGYVFGPGGLVVGTWQEVEG